MALVRKEAAEEAFLDIPLTRSLSMTGEKSFGSREWDELKTRQRRAAPARAFSEPSPGVRCYNLLDLTTTFMDTPMAGTRIRHSGSNGTIRYIGPVDNTTGTWLGVEWDDPHRGKHDGVRDGKRYFTCR